MLVLVKTPPGARRCRGSSSVIPGVWHRCCFPSLPAVSSPTFPWAAPHLGGAR